jgi:hypothetical protein
MASDKFPPEASKVPLSRTIKPSTWNEKNKMFESSVDFVQSV